MCRLTSATLLKRPRIQTRDHWRRGRAVMATAFCRAAESSAKQRSSRLFRPSRTETFEAGCFARSYLRHHHSELPITRLVSQGRVAPPATGTPALPASRPVGRAVPSIARASARSRRPGRILIFERGAWRHFLPASSQPLRSSSSRKRCEDRQVQIDLRRVIGKQAALQALNLRGKRWHPWHVRRQEGPLLK